MENRTRGELLTLDQSRTAANTLMVAKNFSHNPEERKTTTTNNPKETGKPNQPTDTPKKQSIYPSTMTTTATHGNPIRRIDLVHHPTIDSKDEKDPYKYGEGVEARPFRYGFASVDRAIERKERLEAQQQEQQRKMDDDAAETTVSSENKNSKIEECTFKSSSADAAAVNSGNRNDHDHEEEEVQTADHQKKKLGCFENIKSFLNSKKHTGAGAGASTDPSQTR